MTTAPLPSPAAHSSPPPSRLRLGSVPAPSQAPAEHWTGSAHIAAGVLAGEWWIIEGNEAATLGEMTPEERASATLKCLSCRSVLHPNV